MKKMGGDLFLRKKSFERIVASSSEIVINLPGTYEKLLCIKPISVKQLKTFLYRHTEVLLLYLNDLQSEIYYYLKFSFLDNSIISFILIIMQCLKNNKLKQKLFNYLI